MIALRRGAAVALLLLALVPSTARAQTPALTIDALKNGTYPLGSAVSAYLVNGHAEFGMYPGIPGFKTVDFVAGALGPIGIGGQSGGAVVLVTNSVGYDPEYEVYMVDGRGNTLGHRGVAFGNRIGVQSLTLTPTAHIVLDFVSHKLTDPSSAPGVQQRHEYGLLDNIFSEFPSVIPARTGNAGFGQPHPTGTFEVGALALVILGVAFARRQAGGAR